MVQRKFIKNRSTAQQLLQIMDKWTKYLEYGGQIDVMYSDFEKAFDKIPHKRLISKLISSGFNNTLSNFKFKSFWKAESSKWE